jgi:hypothetical protein
VMHLMLKEKQEQAKPWNSRWREIIKIRAKINEIETKKTIQRINETKSWFLEKTNKIDKPLANLTRQRSENSYIYKIKDEKGTSPQIPKKSKGSLGNTLKTYMQVNWKI